MSRTAHKYTIEFEEETWQDLLGHAGRGNIKDYITHLLEREFQAARTRAIILCGGEAADLYPTQIPIPKAMLPVGYRPVVEYLLGHIVEHGIHHITLVAGAKGNVRDHFATLETPGVAIEIVTEPEPQGTAGAVRAVAHRIQGPFVVLNGDLLTTADLTAMVRTHRASGRAATVLVTHPDRAGEHDPKRLGWVEMDTHGRVTSLRQRGVGVTGGTPQHFNAGIYVLEPRVLEDIPETGAASLESDVLPRLIDRQEVGAHVMEASDYWLDVSHPAAFSRAWEDMLTGRFPAKR